MKKLGFGLMRLPLIDPNDLSKVDLEQVKKRGSLILTLLIPITKTDSANSPFESVSQSDIQEMPTPLQTSSLCS